MKYDHLESENRAAMDVAHRMVAAARTAPKGCGKDKLVAFVIDGQEKKKLCEEMRRLSSLPDLDFFKRDAQNVDDSHCIVLLGIKNIPLGIATCSFCGYANCTEAVRAGSLCAFNTTDLGIAVGSAVSLAADNRIDNRVLFSAGKAAMSLGMMGPNVTVTYGIPLSTSSKSIFFDRDPGSVML